MVKEWLNPNVDWLCLYQESDGSLSLIYSSDFVMNYDIDDGFQKREVFTAADLRSAELEHLVRSRFGRKAWDELLFAATHISEEPIQFVDPVTNLCGLKDRNGNLILAAQFNYMWPFHDGLCMVSVVTDRDRRGLIDLLGRIVIPAEYETLGRICQERILFQREFNGPYGYMNRQGKVVIDATFREAADFMGNARAWVMNAAGERGAIDVEGTFVKR